jgi:hypothetical protein
MQLRRIIDYLRGAPGVFLVQRSRFEGIFAESKNDEAGSHKA